MQALRSQTYKFEEFELDCANRELRRDGVPVQLPARSFDLLQTLIENNNQLVSKDEIFSRVWSDQIVEESNLTVHISQIRKALGETKNKPRFLTTVPGYGYRFSAAVQDVNADADLVIETETHSRITIEKEESFVDNQFDENLENDRKVKETQLSAPNQLTTKKTFRPIWVFGWICLAVLIFGGFLGYRYFSGATKNQIKSVAVLPFANKNSDPNIEYLSEGLADSVIYSLSAFPELRVMSRNSAFRYNADASNAKSVGRELNVEAVLTGRIVQVGENVSVRAELVSTDNDSVIWGEQFTRKMSDVEKLQTDIAQSISQKLRLKLSGAEQKRLQNNQSENPEAYRLYLLGRFHLNKLSDEGFGKARDYFAQAIEKDSNYALAYAGLGEAYNRLCGYNVISSNECFPKARQAAQKALELDDGLAEAHATLGAVKLYYDWDFAGAEKDFRRAVEINPNNAEARQLYSYFLTTIGRLDESLVQMEQAHELDPLSIEKINGIGDILYFERQFDRAIEQYKKALEIDPNSSLTYWQIGRALADKGAFDEAIPALQKSISLLGSNTPDELLELARAYARSGKSGEARKIIEDVKRLAENKIYFSQAVLASVYAALGDKDQAFAHLEKGYAERDFLLVLLKVDPMFDPLRDDPRFAELMRRVGLPQ
ncbi:MAG: winged helix-turn-helix domain-containing protein [Acidobacteriota bacterium]|nr:winged helix-turn-helix domain-containing protein [Acidobacteriota bacterium]